MDEYCCKELEFAMKKGSFEEKDGKVITREGMQEVKFCPFCGKELAVL